MGSERQPSPDEIEVSIFGPGYGESILVHLGHGDWLIVDSCEDQHTKQLPVLSYLDGLGVDLDRVVHVAATHWHDDHVRGISRVFEQCSESEFSCSMALAPDEARAVIRAPHLREIDERPTRGRSSGVAEMRAVFDLIAREAKLRGRRRRNRLRWAIADRPLFTREDSDVPALVRALSPSDEAVTAATSSFAAYLHQGVNRRARLRPGRNYGAVAMWVEVGPVAVLLGADLEVTGNPLTGWKAVAGAAGAGPRAEVYKAAHHGSSSGDHAPMWAKLLCDRPYVLVCPWQLADGRLPSADDLERLCGRTSTVWLSAPADPGHAPTTGVSGETIVGEHSPAGRVTLRRNVAAGADWDVETAPPAYAACVGAAPTDPGRRHPGGAGRGAG